MRKAYKFKDRLTDREIEDISFKHFHGVNINTLAIQYKCSYHTMRKFLSNWEKGII